MGGRASSKWLRPDADREEIEAQDRREAKDRRDAYGKGNWAGLFDELWDA